MEVAMKIFIGSSTKHIHIAEEIALIIEKCEHKPILWTEWFEPTDFTFNKILDLPNEVDGGIFILAPDDELNAEQEAIYVPRDNVLIEAGVLFGKLGAPCVELCKVSKTKLASDWAGITNIKYEPEKQRILQTEVSQWLKKIQDSIANKEQSISNFLSMEMPDFEKLMSSATDEIMISSFFIGVAQTSRALSQAITNGVKVRLIFADYWGNSLQATATMLDGLGTNSKRIKMKLKTTLQFFATQYEKGDIPSNLEIRFIDYVFPTRMTVIDPNSEQGHMYVHISSYINRTAPKTTFHLTKQDSWFNIYKQEFERIWQDARPIDFEELNAALSD